MNTASLRGIVLLVTAFAAGALSGVAADRSLTRRASAAGTTRVMLRTTDVLDRLDLSADQRRAADAILARSSPRSEAAMRDMVPRLAAIADSVNAELAVILTSAQRARLDSMTHGPLFLLKRKDSAGNARVDTIRR